MPRPNQTSRDCDEMHKRLSWYEKVSTDQRPAKYRLARRVVCDLDLDRSSDELLWEEHQRLSGQARVLQSGIDDDSLTLTALPIASTSLLDLKQELLRRMLHSCVFCEWNCKVDRIKGAKKGVCRLDSASRLNNWFLHFGEEPPLVGRGGSGTIFFSSCNFRCVFCQNWDISQDPLSGVPLDSHQLALIAKNLRDDGALNINFVGGDPTPN
ncbi:4Fe-4S cluster-binding domain-containing protein, partial [bacterium]